MYIFNISVIAIIYLLYIFFLQLVVSFNFISNKYLATHNYVNPPREYIGFEFDGLKEKDGSIYFFFSNYHILINGLMKLIIALPQKLSKRGQILELIITRLLRRRDEEGKQAINQTSRIGNIMDNLNFRIFSVQLQSQKPKIGL